MAIQAGFNDARTSGAAKALGAPKGAPSRYLNKASGKMETAKAMKSFKAAPKAAAPRAAPARAAAPAKAPSKGQTFFNPAVPHTEAQLQHLAVLGARQIGNASLEPLKQSYGEIQGAEGRAQQRYGEYAQTGQNVLQGIGQQQEANAKTFENRVAENALKTGQGIETAGQNASSLTGGYLSPELKGELQAEGQRAATTGGAATGLAANLGQNETNYLTNLRATAAQKAVEGHGQIGSTFGKQLAANRAEQNRQIAKNPGEVAKLFTTMGQQQFTDAATRAGLGLKQETLGAKVAGERAKVGATIRGQNLSRANARESVRQRETASQRTAAINAQKQTFNQWATGQKLAISKLSAEDKKRYDEAKTRNTTKPASPKEGRAYQAKISTAESAARALLPKGSRSSRAEQEAARAELRKKGATGDLVSAALNLVTYGRLGPSDQAAAISYGLTPAMRPQWFR